MTSQKNISSTFLAFFLFLFGTFLVLSSCTVSQTVSSASEDSPTPSQQITEIAPFTNTPSQSSTAEPEMAFQPGQQTVFSPAFPLKLASDPAVRYLVDQNNQPFFIVGEAAWSLIGQVSLEDAQLYIDDLAARGFNTIITTLVEGYYADNAPANFYGIEPYIPENVFSGPNEPYFAHADDVINYAASKGILVILSPNYLGCCNDGWRYELENLNTITDAISYGTYIGNRYKNFPNLIYAWGNDMIPDNSNVEEKIDAMASAVKAVDPNHLHTFHAVSEISSWEVMTMYNYNWIDFNSIYTYNPVQGEMESNYDPDGNLNTAPPMPLFLFESHYENDWAGKDALATRREGYVGVLTGASGYAYGNNPIWHMNGHPTWNTTDWHLHLDDEGRADMTHFHALFASRDWVHLVPDLDNTLVVANKGSGDDYSAAALTADGNTAIIFFPYSKSVTVNMALLNGATANVWWFNPRDGSAQAGGTVPNTGTHSFTPPTNADWLLVLDNSDLNPPAPGITPTPTSTPSSSPTPTLSSTPSVTLTASSTPSVTPTSSSTPEPQADVFLPIIFYAR
ncbi:MAG: glycoside hydrolase family 140 protein [Anaerolineales bacterium]|nr:glycoside hydrolase family 140 protein [Anaerolineales bacterium]